MSGAGRLQPPVNDPPVAEAGGQHSQSWTNYFQNVADRLSHLQNGVTDGSDAAAGDVGEYLSASAGVALSSAVVANVASLSLTAGDWDVSGNVGFVAGSGTHSFFAAGIGGIDTYLAATFSAAAINQALSTATRRYNVTAATTVWVVAEAQFTGVMSATGSIRARRMR